MGSAQISNRRTFLKSAIVTGFPTIVPASVFGQTAPSNLIHVAQIGCGRIARASEFPGVLRHADKARFVAISDLDTVRTADAKRLIEESYTKLLGAGLFAPIKAYDDYRDLLADKSIDAVCISTPDHWHAQPAMEAALAGKDVYLQKSASLTIAEGRHMADVLKQTGRVLQIGSQQRSAAQFRLASELVRNGRLGKIKEIYIGLPVDPAGPDEAEQPTPANLNYDMWLGSTPKVYYTENRVHPQSEDMRKRYDRPGWLRCEQFGAGMITGWGAHHIDIAHWAMDMEHTGPIEVTALAEFPRKGLWDVHGSYHVRARYANGAVMYISDLYENGIKFVGEDGWIWVTRGRYEFGEPAEGSRSPVLDCHDPRILRAGVKDNEVHLHASPNNDHHLDWLVSIKTRKENAAPAETGHRSCSACLIAHTAMRLNRTVKWDPANEQYMNDPEAQAMVSRAQRPPWGTTYVKRRRT